MSQTFKQNVNKCLKPYSKNLAEIDQKNVLDLMLQLLEFYIKNGFCSEDKIDKAVTLAPDSQEYFHEAFTGLLLLCQLYLRSPKGFVKAQELQEVIEETKLREEFVEEVTHKFIELKEANTIPDQLQAKIERPLRLTTPKKIDWRINISKSSMDKNITRRTIVLQMTLVNGQIETFVLPISMFHKLRYQVASLMKNIHNLEGRASMKI